MARIVFEPDKNEVDFLRDYEAGALDLDEAEIVDRVAINGKARRKIDETIAVAGTITGQIAVLCDRCLQTVNLPLNTDFDVVYVTPEQYAQSREEDLGDDDLAVGVYDGGGVDLDELVREQILLALPARTVCQETCAGLCLKCGANKNTEDCRCETETIDPRWSGLKELKIKN